MVMEKLEQLGVAPKQVIEWLNQAASDGAVPVSQMEQIAILSLRPYRRYERLESRMTSNYNHRLILIASPGSRLQRRKLWQLVLIRHLRPLYHSRLFRRPCQHRCHSPPSFPSAQPDSSQSPSHSALQTPTPAAQPHFNLHY